MNDIEELTALNRDYVASVQNSDVKRFDEILAPEFYCSNPDKSLVDRAAFLKQTAVPVTIKNLQAHDVKIRVMGDFAIIHAATSYTTADGKPAPGRYTDVWARQNGRWLAVSAHVSRNAMPSTVRPRSPGRQIYASNTITLRTFCRPSCGKTFVDLGQLQLRRDPVLQMQLAAHVELDQPRHVTATVSPAVTLAVFTTAPLCRRP